MNLNQINQKLNHEILCEQIESEFCKFYPDCKVNREVLDYKVLQKNTKINEIFSELKSDDWNFSKTPDFSNQFETRFDWGTVDFFVQVK